MTDRLDALMTREYQSGGETKTAYTKIGVAFATKNGGWAVKLEAAPVPKLGRDGQPEISILLMPPRESDSTSQSIPSRKEDRHIPPSFDDGDNVPF